MSHESEDAAHETSAEATDGAPQESVDTLDAEDLFLDEDVAPDGVIGEDGYLEVPVADAAAPSATDEAGEAEEAAAPVDETVSDGPVDLVEARIAELLEQLSEARTESEETHARLVRKAADFENAKRRHQKEKDDLTKYASESVLKEIVPVMDDLERALEHGKDSEDQSFLEGVQMVQRKFAQSLERRGVTAVDAVGKPFDPQFHEAIQMVEDESVPHNTVVNAFQKGYLLHDRLIRPALVVVAHGGPPHAAPEGDVDDADADAEPAEDAGLADEPASEDNSDAPDSGVDA